MGMEMERNLTIYIHFNKPGAPKGYPWTVHTSKACIPAREVIVQVPTSTVWKPNKKENPRAFIKAKGVVEVSDGVVTIRRATSK